MPVSIEFRSRNNAARKYDSTLLSQFPKDAREDILKQLRAIATLYVRDDGLKLAAALQNAANRKLAQVARFIAKEVIGIRSVPADQEDDGHWIPQTEFTEVEIDGRSGPDWLGLSGRYMDRMSHDRKAKKNYDAHFLKHGNLRRAVAAAGPAIVSATGGVQARVEVVKQADVGKKGTTRVANLMITYAPAARSSGILPGLINGDPLGSFNPNLSFEKRLGFSPETMAKLKGPGDGYIHRPLIQPVVSYWLVYRVPQEIARVFNSFSNKQAGSKAYALQGGR